MAWRCFVVEPAGRLHRYLRRFTWAKELECPERDGAGHDAWAYLDEVEDPAAGIRDQEEKRAMAREADENGNRELLRKLVCGDLWPHNDGRWPKVCEFCGYEFQDGDEWQLNHASLWSRVDGTGDVFELPNAEPGAMWDAWWLEPKGEDGRHLVVKLPDGWEWEVDGPSSEAPAGWERQGEPPEITVSPSIASPGYHGFLVAGELTDDLEGRTYDGEG